MNNYMPTDHEINEVNYYTDLRFTNEKGEYPMTDLATELNTPTVQTPVEAIKAAIKKPKKVVMTSTVTTTTFVDGSECRSIREQHSAKTLTELDAMIIKRAAELGMEPKYIDVYQSYSNEGMLDGNVTFTTGDHYE